MELLFNSPAWQEQIMFYLGVILLPIVGALFK